MQRLLGKNREFYSKLLTLALPITIQSLISSSLGVVDSVMVGSLGNQALAAVGVANQYGLIVFLLYNAIHSGCSIYVAQFWGKNDHSNIGRVVNLDIAIAAGTAFIMAAIGILLPEQIISIFNTDPVVISQGAGFFKNTKCEFCICVNKFWLQCGSQKYWEVCYANDYKCDGTGIKYASELCTDIRKIRYTGNGSERCCNRYVNCQNS